MGRDAIPSRAGPFVSANIELGNRCVSAGPPGVDPGGLKEWQKKDSQSDAAPTQIAPEEDGSATPEQPDL